jgi:5-methylcytosine-specific restriction endonuclease McrA
MRLKEKILKFRKSGMKYNEIANKIPCAKSTVSYYCGEGVKKKTLKYQKDRRIEEPIIKKLDAFKAKSIYTRGRDFQRRHMDEGLKNKMEKNFTVDELRKYIGETPTCYLTGRKIDLLDTKSFALDHFIPVSKGGKNELSNLRISCSQANYAKTDMLYDEFVQLCREVVKKYDSEK